MAMMEISVVPLGTGSPGVSSYVAACLEYLQGTDFEYQLTAMGTIVVGEVESLLRLAAALHQIPFARGAQRVVTSIKIDDRRDKELSISGKIAAVARQCPK